MKRKFLEIRKYLKEDSKNPKQDILWIIGSILSIPFIIIHELCHFITICLTFTNVEIDPKKWYFLSRQEIPYINNEGKSDKRIGLGWEFPVALINNHPLQVLIVGGAPAIGVLFDVFLCFYIPIHLNLNPFLEWLLLQFMIMWLALSLKSAWLSNDDIQCVKVGWDWMKKKISPKLLKIKKLFVYLHLWKDR